MHEGEGVGGQDHGGEVGAVVGHDAAVVNHVDGGSAGAVDANAHGVVLVEEAHHALVTGAEAEEVRADHDGIHVVVVELIVGDEEDFRDGVHREAVVGTDLGAVGQEDGVVGRHGVRPSQLGSVLGEGGGDGLVGNHVVEGGSAVEVVDDGAGRATPALEVVVHLGRGLDGQRGAVVHAVGVFGQLGDAGGGAAAGVDMELDNVLCLEQTLSRGRSKFRIADVKGGIVANGINGLVGVDFSDGALHSTTPFTGDIADA